MDGATSCVSNVGPDVWYALNVTEACLLTVDTCGSSYDTVLSIHSALCPGSSTTTLACNDDACALSSRVQLAAVANTTYLIRVSGWNGAVGMYALNIVCEVPSERDSCSLATPVQTGSYSGSTAPATNDGSAACGQAAGGPDHWFVHTPQSSCLLTVDTCGSGFDTVLSIHTGCPGTTANQIACNDDSCANFGSRLFVAAQSGQSLYIRVAGFNGASGAYTLNVQCESVAQADSCAEAIDITPGLHLADTTGATPDGSSSCAAGSSADVWYRYSPLEDCTLAINTCGGGFDTVVSVHTGCPGTAANEIACSDNDCGAQSLLALAVQSGGVYYIRVAGAGAATGACFVNIACTPGAPVGADIYVGELNQIVQAGREGDIIGCAIDAPLCNSGTEPLDWIVNPDPRHPFMVFNMYRLMNGRFEQIGMSWAKHGWAAAQGNACGFGCTPYVNNSRLGVGCSDTYSAAINAQQSTLGPRHEINPWTGSFTYAGSHFATTQPPHNGISHRLQIRDSDLDPARNPGAVYFCETYILSHDDANRLNSASFEQVQVSGTPGGAWTLDISAQAGSNGPAILAWAGASRTVIPAQTVDDGRCILAVRATDNRDGTWRYEYALYNLDMDRGVSGFAIPLDPATTVTNIGFSAVRSHDEPYHNIPWQAVRTPTQLLWATNPYSSHPGSNPLRWGTMYNFRFDANRPPSTVEALLAPYKPGGPSLLSGMTTGPRQCPADFDGNGAVTVQDIFTFLAAWFAFDPRADSDGNGLIGTPDIFAFLAAWFAGNCA